MTLHDTVLDNIETCHSVSTLLIILLSDSENKFEHPSHTVETFTSSRDPSPRNKPINSNTTLTHHLVTFHPWNTTLGNPTYLIFLLFLLILKKMSATSSAEIDQIVAQRVTDAIEAVAVYETKIRMAHDSINQVVQQGTIAARNANNERKWRSDHGRNSGKYAYSTHYDNHY
nr:hypothetical protein [Tanacetum cinerariifolium]